MFLVESKPKDPAANKLEQFTPSLFLFFPLTYMAHPKNLKKGNSTGASKTEENKRDWYTKKSRRKISWSGQ